MNLLNTGGSLTGGATVAYTPAGVTAGKSVFVGPQHNRTAVDRFSLTVAQTPANSKTGAAGISRAGTQFRREIPVEVDGCCTAKVSQVGFDTQAFANTNASDADVDMAIDRYRALVMTAEWKAAIKTQILPSA
jgi:hypothetical protein